MCRVEGRGAIETAHTLRQNCGQVFRYGIQTGRCERNPGADLAGALKPLNTKHMATVTEAKPAGEPMRAILAYSGHPVTRAALRLAAQLFQRPGELRQMEWTEIEGALWSIPAAKMAPGSFASYCRKALASY